MKELHYQCQGTCSVGIDIVIDDEDRLQSVQFIGGCPGNTTGVSRLVVGMKCDEAIARLKGIPCGDKPTSCPDQLAKALETR